MARKEKVIQHEPTIIWTYYCDFCNADGDNKVVKECFICGRDVCYKCCKFYDVYDGDDMERWCKYCFKLAAKENVLDDITELCLTLEDEVETTLDKFREKIRKRLL